MVEKKCSYCVVGMIGSRFITEDKWENEESIFNKTIELWNEQTKRFAIPHPGFSVRLSYCPLCGHKNNL